MIGKSCVVRISPYGHEGEVNLSCVVENQGLRNLVESLKKLELLRILGVQDFGKAERSEGEMSAYTLDEARRAVEAATKQMVEEIVAVLGKLEPRDFATLVEELDAGNIPVVNWRLPRTRLQVQDARSATEGLRRRGRPIDPEVRSRREEEALERQDRMDEDILGCLNKRERASIQYIAGNIGASAGMTAKALDRLIGWGRIEHVGQEDGKALYARTW